MNPPPALEAAPRLPGHADPELSALRRIRARGRVRGRVALLGPALVAASWMTVLGVVGSFAGLIVRYRRGDVELRQQIRWLGLVAVAGGLCILTSLLSLVACNCDESSVAVFSFTILILIIAFGHFEATRPIAVRLSSHCRRGSKSRYSLLKSRSWSRASERR